jgi:mono/diheme cytochrome c family protein
MSMHDLIYFLGRFHVLILHVPVGVLLLAVGMEALARWPRFFVEGRSVLEPAMRLIWAFGALSAVATVVLGTMHASEPGFSSAGVEHHRWSGTALAFTAVLIWAWRADAPQTFARVWPAGMLAIVALLIVTGHFGGVLTHGPDYLTEYAPGFQHAGRGALAARAKITDPAAADIYLDVVAPLLNEKCSACHSEAKRRGGLSLADYPSLRKGGESGEVIKPGDPAGSELYRRITLPSTAEGYMPKNHKSPPSSAQIDVLRWWIEIGAPEKGVVRDLRPPQSVASDLKQALQGHF